MFLRSARHMAIAGISTNEYNSINGNTSRLKTRGSLFFEIARVLVRVDNVASLIVNADHSAMGSTPMLCVGDCRARPAIPQPTK